MDRVTNNRIAELLKRKGKTQEWLAEQMNVRPSQVNRIINSAPDVKTSTAIRIARALGSTVEQVFYTC